MEKQIAIKLAGSASKLAKLLGVKRQSVHKWKSIPEGRVWQLKVLKPEWFDELLRF
jgi:cytochrome c551/c552